MASFNDLLAQQTVTPTAVCSVAKWRGDLSPTDRAQFEAAAADASIQHAVLWRTMKALGFEAGTTAVQRHRTGGCKCPSPKN